jgi:hypothetical protein
MEIKIGVDCDLYVVSFRGHRRVGYRRFGAECLILNRFPKQHLGQETSDRDAVSTGVLIGTGHCLS